MSDTKNPPEAKDDSRRGFLNRALVSVTLSRLLARRAAEAQTSGRACLVQCFDDPMKPGTNCGLELVNPPEIASGSDGMLHAILRVHKEDRAVPALDTTTNPPRAGCQTLPLRSMEGYKGFKMVESARVTTPGKAAPGPTFRAAVGETVQIALLNHIGPTDFPATTNINNPNAKGCDVVVRQDGTTVYPSNNDATPNCFHAANTMNIHFHGTHVTPDCWGDNVLVSVYPDPKSTAEECEPIFAICKDATCPKDWAPHRKAPDAKRFQSFTAWKKKAFGKLGKMNAMLESANEENEAYGDWPQYWPGYYPNCLSIPKWTKGGKFAMGQAPGTHWYHTHQHGSTSVHMLNGLAGAFIITGDYDDVLLRTMPKVQQKVLVLQQFQTQPNLERGSGQVQFLNVNGQLHPVITMKPGEVQWWRLVNATVQANAINQFAFMTPAKYAEASKNSVGKTLFTLPDDLGSPIPKFRQTAQDGVQFAWDNYDHQRGHEPTRFVLAPANRADILVQAPMQPGVSVLVFGAAANSPNPSGRTAAQNANIVAYVNVVADSSGDYNKKWPEQKDEYPVMPEFLDDIVTVKGGGKTLTFDLTGPGGTPKIDGNVFSDHRVDQCVLLGDVVEWTLQNNSPIMHPFHIHVNPFQVVQVFDPNKTPTPPPYLPQPWIWWDTFALPPANGTTASFVKIRTKFVDFPGKFVLHCHILAHEDRGMMQLVEVRDNWTPITHGQHSM